MSGTLDTTEAFDPLAHLQRERMQICGLVEQITQQIATATIQLRGLDEVLSAIDGRITKLSADTDQLELNLDIR